jgi:hypothetical protein
MIAASVFSAILNASSDLPEAVGPEIKTTLIPAPENQF